MIGEVHRTVGAGRGPGQARRVTSRRLSATEEGPALEVVEAAPEGRSRGAPILFLHGAFGGAWTWSEILMPFLARQGRASAAVSLRGHGRSDGRAELRRARLSDYVADARRAFQLFPEPPVVVGHSLGGLVGQMLIGREQMRGLALLASLPPEGMLFEGPRIALQDPTVWLEAYLGSLAQKRQPIVAAAHDLLFSEGLPRERVARYAAMMAPEAPGALADAHAPGPVISALLVRLPALVVGGAADRLVSRNSVMRTALYHAARHESVAGAGHFLPLDVQAETVASLLLDWLDERGL